MPHDPARRYHPHTRLIHGLMHSSHWQYADHIVPPISASAAYRLESAERGAEGFLEYANPDLAGPEHAPIYIYDRLDEPTRGMLEENLALAEGAGCAAAFATGMAAIAARAGRAHEERRPHRGAPHAVRLHVVAAAHLVPALRHRHRARRPVASPSSLDPLLDDPRVMVVYLETPVNPTLELIDLRRGVREGQGRQRAPPAPRAPGRGASSWWWTTPSPRPSASVPSGTGPTSWCTA